MWTSESSLRCVVPPGVGRELRVSLNVLGNSGIWLEGLSYNVPNIQSIFPGLGPSSGGGNLTILGAVRMASLEVRVGGMACISSNYGFSVFVLQCITPPGSGLRFPVSVSVEGQISTLQAAYVHRRPCSIGSTPPEQSIA